MTTSLTRYADAVIGAVLAVAHAVRRRLTLGRQAADRGASAIEFAIIAAVVVVAASLIGGIVYKIVDTKGKQLQTCADQPVGGSCTPAGEGN